MAETSTRNESVGLFQNSTTHRLSMYFEAAGWNKRIDETDPDWVAWDYEQYPFSLRWDDDACEGVELLVNGSIATLKELRQLIQELVYLHDEIVDVALI